ADRIEIDTGAVRFHVNTRRFAGVQDVRRVRSDGTVGPVLTGDAGGAFLIDERGLRYEAARDQAVRVVVEEAGPVRVTIAATGWYLSDMKERGAIFQTRVTAYAGLPIL